MSEERELTRGECIADPYHVPTDRAQVAAIVDLAPEPTSDETQAPPQISREDQRRIERYLIEQRLAPRPMDSHMLGKIKVDGRGQKYVQHGGGLHRAHIDEQGNVRILTKWGKARRKAEKRARRDTRATNSVAPRLTLDSHSSSEAADESGSEFTRSAS